MSAYSRRADAGEEVEVSPTPWCRAPCVELPPRRVVERLEVEHPRLAVGAGVTKSSPRRERRRCDVLDARERSSAAASVTAAWAAFTRSLRSRLRDQRACLWMPGPPSCRVCALARSCSKAVIAARRARSASRAASTVSGDSSRHLRARDEVRLSRAARSITISLGFGSCQTPRTRASCALAHNPTKVDADQLRALVAEHASAAGGASPFYETSVDDPATA